MRSLFTALIALIFLSVPAPGAVAGEPVKILWITRLPENSANESAKATATKIQERTGIAVEMIVRLIGIEDSDEPVIVIAQTAIARDRAELIFGLSLDEVELLAENGILSPISQRRIGFQRSRSLYVKEALNPSGASEAGNNPDNVLAVPHEVSIPVMCYDRKNLSFPADSRPSIFDIAYGKLAQRIAIADPRFDSVGRTILLSTFDAAGGVNEGWRLVEELDRNVVEYSWFDALTCDAVREGRAQIGFTDYYGISGDITESDLGYQMLDRVHLIPFHFASALTISDEPMRDDAIRVLRWTVEDGLQADLDVLESSLSMRGWQYDAQAMAESKGALEYLPVERLVREWGSRYDHKSERGMLR